MCSTLGKQNYFMGYEILLHELPVLFTQSIQKMLHSVVHVFELQNSDVVKYGINLVK